MRSPWRGRLEKVGTFCNSALLRSPARRFLSGDSGDSGDTLYSCGFAASPLFFGSGDKRGQIALFGSIFLQYEKNALSASLAKNAVLDGVVLRGAFCGVHAVVFCGLAHCPRSISTLATSRTRSQRPCSTWTATRWAYPWAALLMAPKVGLSMVSAAWKSTWSG